MFQLAREWVLAVDTGLNAFGWALWAPQLQAGRARPPQPSDAGVELVPKKLRQGDWIERVEETRDLFVRRLTYVLNEHNPQALRLVMELPEYRGGDAVGHAAASRESLGALYLVCGVMHSTAWHLARARSTLVRVSEWKGSLPKRVVEARLRASGALTTLRGAEAWSHAVDAVGIGLHVLGHDVGKMSRGAKP